MAEQRERIPTFPGSGKTVVLPDLGAPTADTHAHLDMLADPAGALARASRARVALICSVVDLTEAPEVTLDGLAGWLDEARAGRVLRSSKGDTVGAPDPAHPSSADGTEGDLSADCLDLGGEEAPRIPATAAPDVRLILGVHPHNASHYDDAMHDRLRELVAAQPAGLVVGLGELGLDFHYDHSPREAQRDAFRRQLELAHELALPITVHLRSAHDEGYDILREIGVPEAGCIIHCFTEGPETAGRFLALSDAVVISIAGPVSFAKAQQIRDALHVVPLDRLLAETDSPFLAPAPYRGEANEPAFVTLTVARIAGELGLEPSEVASATLRNARRVFGIG